MTTTGRPPVPIELKRKRGTLRADQLPNGVPIPLSNSERPPEPPEGLLEKGRGFWSLVFSQAVWVSQATDRALVELTAALFDEREQLRPLVVSDPSNTRLRASLRDLEKALVSNLALMGFTPADRSRLGFAEVKRESKLQELIRRKEEHAARYAATEKQ